MFNSVMVGWDANPWDEMSRGVDLGESIKLLAQIRRVAESVISHEGSLDHDRAYQPTNADLETLLMDIGWAEGWTEDMWTRAARLFAAEV